MSPDLESRVERLEAKLRIDDGQQQVLALLREAGATEVANHLEELINGVRTEALSEVAFLRARLR